MRRQGRAFDASVELSLHPRLPQQQEKCTFPTNKNHKVYLVEYGAGFFVERTAKESTDFYNRKIGMIKEKINKLQEIIAEKR